MMMRFDSAINTKVLFTLLFRLNMAKKRSVCNDIISLYILDVIRR